VCASAAAGGSTCSGYYPIGFVVLFVAVAAAQGLRGIPSVHRFIELYPGTVEPAGSERNAGLPLWVGAQHFLTLFLMIFIIRSGVQILSDHPRLYWTRHSTPGKDWFHIQKPVPADPLWTAKQDSISLPGQIGLPGIRHSIGLARWWHLGIDTLWLLNGLVFYVLLFATPHWRRLVPTSWDVFPNAVSELIQSPVAELANRKWLGRLQQPAAARLLHHRVRRRPTALSSLGSACHPRSRPASSGSARCSASRRRAHCTSSCWSGSSCSS